MTQIPKMIFFDMDGTLIDNTLRDSSGDTAPSTWTLIAQHIGEEALKEEEQTKIKWTNKGYKNYIEWMDKTAKIHKKYGLDKDFFYKIINSIKYFPGVEETMKTLHANKIPLVLITGSFKELGDKIIKELGFKHVFASIEYFWDENGKLLTWNLLPADYLGKVAFMELMMKEHNLTKEDCAFIGDGRNDISLAKAVGTSIAFNGAKELQDISTFSINQPEGQKDFRAILPLLGIECN
ncbi:MAG: HAD-IB family phosphatase [archaeon]